jgi:hypothetical protein
MTGAGFTRRPPGSPRRRPRRCRFPVTVGRPLTVRSALVVWNWRKAFGVGGHATTKGSRKALRSAARKGAEAIKSKERTDEDLAAKSELSKRLGLRPTGTDVVAAKRIGRTPSAVSQKRATLGVRPARVPGRE